MSRGYLLVRSEDGTAELLRHGKQLWASDTDPDLLEELGTDVVRDADCDDVVEYLVDEGYLTEEEADGLVIESPEDDTSDLADDDVEGDDEAIEGELE